MPEDVDDTWVKHGRRPNVSDAVLHTRLRDAEGKQAGGCCEQSDVIGSTRDANKARTGFKELPSGLTRW